MARRLLGKHLMQPLTRTEVLELVGPIDDQLVAAVIETGADQTALELAVERLRDDTHVDREVLDPNVIALCDLLAPVVLRDEDEEIAATD